MNMRKFKRISLLLLFLSLFLPRCARVVTEPIRARKILEISFWMDASLEPANLFYFIVLQVDTDKSDWPFHEVSGENRGKNWTDYFLYTSHTSIATGPFSYKKINPQNDMEQILGSPERFDRKVFYLDARLISRPVGGQSRSNNGVRIQVYLTEFLGNATRFDLTFLVATAGVDQISNPPGPNEPGRIVDALNNAPLEIPSLGVGAFYSSTTIVGETTGDSVLPSADIAGWEVLVKQ